MIVGADQLYLGMFSGALAMLFFANFLCVFSLKENRFLLINFLILCLFCFFTVDKEKFSALTGLNGVESWLIAAAAPLLAGMIVVTLLVRELISLKQESPAMDQIALTSIGAVCVGLIVCVLPFAAKFSGHPDLTYFLESIVRSTGLTVIVVFAIAGWSPIFFAPVQRGELRQASAVSVSAMALFLIAYCFILYGILPPGELVSNLMRLAVIVGIGGFMLAYYRHAELAADRRERNKSDKRERSANREEKQRSQEMLKQAHIVRVLRREKALEAELRMRETERNEALREAKKAADEVAHNKSQFLAFMSHEIRTPLNGIMGMVRLLSNSTLSSQQRDYIETLNYSGEALLSLVNDTLDLSKIEAGRLELESIDFDLERLIGSNIMLMSARASEKGLLIRSDIEQDVPRFIKGDPTRIRQILLNLINNAIKFTERGGVTIAVKLRSDSPEGKIGLRFEVQDTGPGISEAGKERLFKEYSQTSSSTARLYGGTGLGLSICKQLVTAMGGQIGVDSIEGEGSTFWFAIDFLKADGAEVMGDLPGTPADMPALSILVVEDNDIHQKVIAGYLKFDGHKVTAVASAEEAIDLLAVETFDAVLMDVNLPGMNGNEATRRIRAHPNKLKRSVPIIAITGNTSPADIVECREAGMNDFLGKPVDPEALRQTVIAAHDKWRAENGDAGVPIASSAPAMTDASPRPALSVLIVDDNDINQKVIAGYLTADGHTSEIAINGEKAVAMAAERLYDLILMDVTLPGIDGLEASRRIRALEEPAKNNVPIVAITGNVGAEDVRACREAGMNDFLGKPIDPASLRAVLTRLEPRFADPLDDYLPQDHNGPILLDKAVIERLTRTFDHAMLSGLMTDMLSESAEMISQMQRAAINQDHAELRVKAHTLKGMAMTLGIAAVGEKAADIESAVARDEKAPALMGMVSQLQQIFEQSKATISAWQDSH